MKNLLSPAKIGIGAVCLVMAFVVTMQIKSVSRINKLNGTNSLRAEELYAQLRQEQEKNDELNKQVLQYKTDIDSFKKEAAENSGYSKTIVKQLEKAELLAGLTEVEGGGVVVQLKDSTTKSNLVENNNAYVIHDLDILQVINELCDAGAEAISLNGERIVSTSEIRCAGATVSVNNNRYAAPFIIKAIGDPTNLENALLMRDGIYDTLTYYGIDVSVKKVSNQKISAYTGSIDYKYAVPTAAAMKKEGQ